MKITIKKITASTNATNEPYDDDAWSVRFEEVREEITTAFRNGYFNNEEFFILLDRLNNITPNRPYENLSAENQLRCSDALDTLSSDMERCIQDRQ